VVLGFELKAGFYGVWCSGICACFAVLVVINEFELRSRKFVFVRVYGCSQPAFMSAGINIANLGSALSGSRVSWHFSCG